LLAPKSKRKHIYSIYAFARTADDFADEGHENGPSESARLTALNDWERKLEASYRGEANHPVFIALAQTAIELALPVELFRDLLSAFKQDVLKHRYAHFNETLDYCQRSANPVGRLILRLFDHRDANLDQLSDSICTALQLTNFWQDVAIDIRKDRVYLPQDEMAHFGVTVHDLREGKFSEGYAALLRFQVERTKELFLHGRGLPSLVGGRLAFELRLTWLGGMRILQQIEEQGYNTLSARPKITAADKVRLLVRAMMGNDLRD
jgi:phytoene synthase